MKFRFEALSQTADEFQLAADAVERAKKEMADIRAAVGQRLNTKHAEIESRIKNLERIVTDSTVSQTVRALANDELAVLQKTTYVATSGEIAAFDAASKHCFEALCAIREIQSRFRNTLGDVKKELEDARAVVLGFDVVLRSRHLDGANEEFNKKYRGERE